MLRSAGFSVLVVLVATFASSVLAFSQVTLSQTDASEQAAAGSSPVAFVYVSAQKGSNYEVSGYSVATNGQLTPIPGSPFPANANYLALNGKYVFGSDGINIYSFSVGSDGALTQVATVNARNYNEDECGGPENLFVDRTGTTLYDPDLLGNICANNAYQAFGIDSSTGGLTYLGSVIASPAFNTPLNFIGDNVYGYSSDCYRDEPGIFGYARSSTGELTETNVTAQVPKAPPGDYYCPNLASTDSVSTDSGNHVAIPMMPMSVSTWQPDGASQIAVYSADSSGNLTTSSTAANMEKTAVNSVTDIRISPNGKLIAVAGTSGLQVFHFNGANPVTHFTRLLTNAEVDHIAWDSAGHLYAISISAGKLMVFTMTSTGATQAAGSPYAIGSPQNLAVLEK
jgi:WD40 repeat protein